MTASSSIRSVALAGAFAAVLTPDVSQGQSAPPDRFAALRHVNLGDSAVWVGFSGQFRSRGEAWTNFNFAAPATANPNDTFVLDRFLLGADIHAGQHARFFVQAKSSTSTDRALLGGRRVIDVDEFDVQQAYVEGRVGAASGALSLRAGRQDLAFGRERLLGTSDWANTRRTFEGASGGFTSPTSAVTAFWARPVPVRKYEFNRSDSTTSLYGAYATHRVPDVNLGLDAYWIRLDRQGAAFNGTAGRELRHTVGARVFGPLRPTGGIDYDVEAGTQFGSVADTNAIRASFVASQIGYAMPRARGSRVYAGLDYGSGDRAAGGEVGTFNVLYGSPHPYFGFMDVIGRQNALDLSVGASASRALGLLGAQADVHRFTRASANDGIYNKLGAPIARTGTLAMLPTSIGTELDLTVRYPFDRYLLISSGWSMFWPGDFIKQSGPSQRTGFSYLSLQYTI